MDTWVSNVFASGVCTTGFIYTCFHETTRFINTEDVLHLKVALLNMTSFVFFHDQISAVFDCVLCNNNNACLFSCGVLYACYLVMSVSLLSCWCASGQGHFVLKVSEGKTFNTVLVG